MTLTLSNTVVTSNTATSWGGGMFIDVGSATLSGAPTQVVGNLASHGGVDRGGASGCGF